MSEAGGRGSASSGKRPTPGSRARPPAGPAPAPPAAPVVEPAAPTPALPEDEAQYLRAVEARFVALRGQGYALSARDVGRVLGWRADGVPLRVALGVLEEEVIKRRREAPSGEAGTARPLTLAAFEKTVQTATRRWVERAAASAPGKDGERSALPPYPRLRAAIEEAGRGAGPARDALREAWRTLAEREAAGADAWETALGLDKQLSHALEALLPPAEREALERAVAKVNDAKMSASARAEQAAFERARLLRQAFAVPELLEVLIRG
ncbi:MAG: hypothetical protein U1F43_12660 [Myxococcota bacterium]